MRSAHSDAAPRKYTRLLLMYNLTPQIPIEGYSLHSMTDALDLGRFTAHVKDAGSLLPRMVFHQEVHGLLLAPGLVTASNHMRRADIILAVTPRGDPLLFVDVEISHITVSAIAKILYITWQHRAGMRVDQTMLLDWLVNRLRELNPESSVKLTFGRNAHQSVFPGSHLRRRILADHRNNTAVTPDIVTILLRGTLDSHSGSWLGIRRPETLNNPGQTMVAHGRGVSLIVGWTPAVENAFGLAAAGLVNAVAAVHRIRGEAFDALEHDRTTDIQTVDQARKHIRELSRRLSAMQLDLSFSVEAYADAILIPEMVVESFHSSLRGVTALAEGIANTSRIVRRVEAVLATRRVVLETASQQYRERRDKVLTFVISAVSILAIPPALLLAFFSVNSNDVNPKLSILDVHRYAVPYLLAWLPFLIVMTIGLFLRYKIRWRISD